MAFLRFFVLIALVTLCCAMPTERTFYKRRPFINKRKVFPLRKPFFNRRKFFFLKKLPFYGCYRCPRNTVCAGRAWAKKCVIPMTVGQRCGVDPFWVCQKGLRCRKNICVQPPIRVGGDCTRSGSVCEPKAVCVGTELKKKCVKPRGPGMRCGQNPFRVCERGLECSRGRCMTPKIGLGGDCKPEGSVCEDGLFCLGDNGLRKCVKGMTEGQKCGLDPFWSCQPGLSCVGRICVHP